jgi:hypothetical protein
MASRKQDGKAIAALLLLLAAAVATAIALPFIGARNMVRGYERTKAETILITGAWNAALIAAGIGIGALTLPYILSALGSHPSSGAPQPDYTGAVTLTAISAIVGFIFGAIERPKRKELFAIANDNMQFMARIGFRATGAADVTHYDAENNPLRYLETRGNQQVFMAVGRRNRRAYIDLDATGRMTRYSGIVSL